MHSWRASFAVPNFNVVSSLSHPTPHRAQLAPAMATPLAHVALGFLLAFAPAIARLVSRFCVRPELYAHDREARILNLAPPATRWMNLGQPTPPPPMPGSAMNAACSVLEEWQLT